MGARDDLRTAVRSILLTLTPAIAGKVIWSGNPQSTKGPRPALPYVTVRITAPTSQLFAETTTTRDDGGGSPEEFQSQIRSATASLQGYGSTSYDWLDALTLELNSPQGLIAQETAGVDAQVLTPLADIGALLDTAEETRCSLELLLFYRYSSAAVAGTPLSRTEVALVLRRYEGDPDTMDASFVLDEDGELVAP